MYAFNPTLGLILTRPEAFRYIVPYASFQSYLRSNSDEDGMREFLRELAKLSILP